MFKLFKKKNKKLSENEIQWNKLWELYANTQWDNPIFYLCDYYSGINGGGHLCFFDNKEDELETYNTELKKILPKDLYDNFNKAYQIVSQGNDKQEEQACDIADDCFYQNEDRIIEILQQYANTLK